MTTHHILADDRKSCLECGETEEWLLEHGAMIVYASNESMIFNLMSRPHPGAALELRDAIWESSTAEAEAYARNRFPGEHISVLPDWSSFHERPYVHTGFEAGVL